MEKEALYMQTQNDKLKKSLMLRTFTIFDSLEIICKGNQIGLIIDENGILLGTLTDGDVRRAMLRHMTMETNALQIANLRPVTVTQEASNTEILEIMLSTKLSRIPVLDQEGRVIDLKILNELIRPPEKKNSVVIMAGGIGQRLKYYTEFTPKPLLHVGDRPIIQTIIEQIASYGFKTFFVSLNYKSATIKNFLGDGSRWGVHIKYIEEKKKLGTAGALSLLRDEITESVLVINGDILTKLNFESLLDFHVTHNSEVTVTCKKYNFRHPYGILKIVEDGVRVAHIKEKPVDEHLINAGIYVLSANIVKGMPYNKKYDMTTLLMDCLETGKLINAFPIHEYWLDIGNIDDYNASQKDYYDHFS